MQVLAICGLFTLGLLSACAVVADDDNASADQTMLFDNSPCEDRICPRVYDPVCGTVDGVPMTAPSRCDLGNKIRCSRLLRSRRDLHGHIPVVRFLHRGECDADVDSSTVVRMRRSPPQDDESDESDESGERVQLRAHDAVDSAEDEDE